MFRAGFVLSNNKIRRPVAVVAALAALPLTGAAATSHTPTAVAMSAIGHMTLEEKVGQLFTTHVYGRTVDSADPDNVKEFGLATPREIVQKYHLGGILYFAWTHSVDSPQQAAGLSNGLQRAAIGSGAHLPLLISIDQEGGIVARIGPPATQFPGNMATGAGRSATDARTTARIQGQELKAVGVTQDFAPVADVNVNPLNPVIGVRSFGSDPQLVSSMVSAQVTGYQRDARISATAKHFPGHGDTAVDSHYGFPVINHTRQQWEQIDAPPFKAAIASGIDAIMTAHIQVPALDNSGDPATLSKPILTGILRGELGFRGVIATDSLGMAGVRQKYGDARVPVLALKAGVDMLLNPPDLDVAYNAVLAAVRSGELTESRIDQSVFRILLLKLKQGVLTRPYVDASRVPQVVGTPAHLAAAQAITDRTVTAIKNDAKLLPLTTGARKVLVTGWGASTLPALAGALGKRGATTRVVETGATPADTSIATAVDAAQGSDLTVVLTMKAFDTKVTNPTGTPTDPDGRQQKLVHHLIATGKPVVVVAVRDPYDIAYLTEAQTYLATFSYGAGSMESLARVLFGEVRPAGKLPVAIPTAGDVDKPLYPYGLGLSW
ncbi:glycoside hydrolase family 3 protein [Fodinicola acaciae]|uniref:glycoside hydrolase family 3 protein n=1 Tax=Fodinicola acaciae TaxID=2681555 RepID=UPI001C9E4A42|nr:glycoside hydrolase family 3 protein [Fodinicola acaciae]